MSVDASQSSAAARLFEFLRDVQRLRVKPVLALNEYLSSGGLVVDLDSAPLEFGVDVSGLVAPDEAAPVLMVPRIGTLAAPAPPDELKPWLLGNWSSPGEPPQLVDSLAFPAVGDSGTTPLDVVEKSLASHPEIELAYTTWLKSWTMWAERERSTKPTRDLYQKLYVARETIEAASQEWELVLGVGRLRWSPADRHVLVQPIRIDLDEASGALIVMREDPFTVEQDMLNPQQLPSADATAALWADLGLEYDPDLMAERLKTYTNRLNSEAMFGPSPSSASIPWMRPSPSIILRKRSKLGLVEVLNQIAIFLNETQTVPEGLLSLVDPDSARPRPHEMQPRTDGAVHWNDEEYFLPLPVNAEQFEVIRRVDHQPLTLVQGPPGTGKTHTTAALVSHLLAQGKRVLVTAQTEQALREVREKLPPEIQDLAVAVLGTGHTERALLTRSVGILAERAHHHSQSGVEREVEQLKADLDVAAQRRAQSRNRLVQLREIDVATHNVGSFAGTRAQIAEQVNALRGQFEWTLDLLDDELGEKCTMRAAEWLELLHLLRDKKFVDLEQELAQPLPDLELVASASTFAVWVAQLAEATKTLDRFQEVGAQITLHPLRQCSPEDLSDLAVELTDVRAAMVAWVGRTEPWVTECLSAIQNHKAATWLARQSTIQDRIESARTLTVDMGDEHSISVDGSLDGLGTVMAQAVLDHVLTGEVIKTDALGNPKIGMFTSKLLKSCTPLFAQTRVDGRPPVTQLALQRLIARIDLTGHLGALDAAWPSTVVPTEDTLSERLAWHEAELDVLDKLLAFAQRMDDASERLRQAGIGEVDWSSTGDVDQVLSFIDFLAAERSHAAAREPLSLLESGLTGIDRPGSPSPSARRLALTVTERNVFAYTEALEAAAVLKAVLVRRDKRDELLKLAKRSAPVLAVSVESSPYDAAWEVHLGGIESAWSWRYAFAWLRATRPESINQLQQSIRADEDLMREIVAKIAAHLAWSKSVGRLKQSQISDLVQYTQLVKKLGKGTGKYAARQQQEILKVLSRCTDAVPVWIVPLHRVATQFRIEPEIFDVVIVDEASQAGLDATFLQFLGKKIVVVGDDKQVSPTVIIDHSNVHRLAEHYLSDSPYAATWSDPERSLFDEARAKYPDLITLVEHRRCVPDIIGFSNEIAYEPEGIRLKPVRETGSSALEPVIPVFMENGYAEGSGSNRRNPIEARAIVDTIKDAIKDSRYDGKTFGVISLLGEAQARLIESLLLDEVGPVEISKRQLRCGVPATFQGAERDVILLSMVSATDDENRFAAQTRESAVQRYNVAVSRAKDQLWVFHSEPLANLANPEDLRRRLLEYAGRVSRRRGSGVPGASQDLASEDVRIRPFDSLFEQRVHNRIFERGYVLVPQYESLGYKIDLVVVGERGKFAIECDGDNWHGADQYMADLARQRELERCGWRFFRIRESDFMVDPFGSLEPLWPLLEALDSPVDQVLSMGSVHAITSAAEVEKPATPQIAGLHPDLEDQVSSDEFTEEDFDALLGYDVDRSQQFEERSPDAKTLHDQSPGDRVTPPVDQSDVGMPNPSPDSPRVGSEALAVPKKSGISGDVRLAQYTQWSSPRLLPPVMHEHVDALAKNLQEIVRSEGPVLGGRLMRAYLQASAGLRLGKNMIDCFNHALVSLARQGLIMADNPTRTRNPTQVTFRTPEQAVVRLRTLGPRSLYEVPQMELREVIARIHGSEDLQGSDLWKEVLNTYGLYRLEDKAKAHLERIAQMSRPALEQVEDA